MKEFDKIRAAFVAVFTALNGFLGALAIPFYILVGANVFDYVTGIIASAYRGEKVSSERGLHGIAKKICMWLLVAIGCVLDYCIKVVGQSIGFDLKFNCLVAIAVVFWLIFNELISILENIHDIGTPLPPFLMKLVKYIKDKTEETMEIPEAHGKEDKEE